MTAADDIAQRLERNAQECEQWDQKLQEIDSCRFGGFDGLFWAQDFRAVAHALAVANARADAAEADRDRHHTTLTTLLHAVESAGPLSAIRKVAVNVRHGDMNSHTCAVVADWMDRVADAAAAATQQDTPGGDQ